MRIWSLFLCCFLTLSCAAKEITPNTVDIEYAKALVVQRAYNGKEGYDFVMRELDRLDKRNLEHLGKLLEAGWHPKSTEFITTSSMLERFYSIGIFHAVADRLGRLRCDRIVEGRIKMLTSEAASGMYYTFETNSHETIREVFFTDNVVRPFFEYWPNSYDTVRICLQSNDATLDYEIKEAIKIELLE